LEKKRHISGDIVKTQGGVYKITCTIDGRLYIGSSMCMSARWKEHRYHLGLGIHKSRHLQRAWNKYGADAFTFEVLQYEGDRDAREVLEQRFLDTLLPFGAKGFNSAREVGTTRGIKPTDEQRRRKAEARRGCRHTAATKELLRLGKLGELNPQFGKPLSDKQRAALVRRGEDHPWFGRQHSAETCEKLSKQRRWPIWQIAPDGTPVKLWPGAVQAAEAIGLKCPESIYRACTEAHRKAAGFHWRYDRNVIS
jgi:group I intron endonuclease